MLSYKAGRRPAKSLHAYLIFT